MFLRRSARKVQRVPSPNELRRVEDVVKKQSDSPEITFNVVPLRKAVLPVKKQGGAKRCVVYRLVSRP